eukprot:gene20490-biopygen2582
MGQPPARHGSAPGSPWVSLRLGGGNLRRLRNKGGSGSSDHDGVSPPPPPKTARHSPSEVSHRSGKSGRRLRQGRDHFDSPAGADAHRLYW